jgi:hypothetical protein
MSNFLLFGLQLFVESLLSILNLYYLKLNYCIASSVIE